MRYNFLAISFLILISISCVSATQIDIVYLNENMTTDIYYSTGNNMFFIQNNTINTTDDLTNVLIRNQYETTDIINDPASITKYGILIFWVVMLITMLMALVYGAKRLFT